MKAARKNRDDPAHSKSAYKRSGTYHVGSSHGVAALASSRSKQSQKFEENPSPVGKRASGAVQVVPIPTSPRSSVPKSSPKEHCTSLSNVFQSREAQLSLASPRSAATGTALTEPTSEEQEEPTVCWRASRGPGTRSICSFFGTVPHIHTHTEIHIYIHIYISIQET